MTTNNKSKNDLENPKPKDEVSSEDNTQYGDIVDEPINVTPRVMKREETGETENSEEDNNDELSGNNKIPSVKALIYDFNGSIGFVIGSSGFIFSLYRANWLPYFRYGCIAWIWGCLAYATPILSLPTHDDGKKYSCTDIGVLLCLFLFIAGCILGGFFSEEQVLEWLVHINYLFVFGSFALAIEPLCQAGYFLIRCATCSARLSETVLLGSNSGYNGKLSLNWDRVLELLAMSSFCVAGAFGGFGPNTIAITTGVYFWEVGSIFCFFRSLFMWHTRRVGLRRLAAAATTTATKKQEHGVVEC